MMTRKLGRGPAGEAPCLNPHAAFFPQSQSAGPHLTCDAGRRDDLRYETPQQLLDMWNRGRADLMERFKEVLGCVLETRRLRPSDLQLPIRLSPFDTSICPLSGYEGGEFDPERLGVACIVVPPTEGRGSNTKGSWSVSQAMPPPIPFLTTRLPSIISFQLNSP